MNNLTSVLAMIEHKNRTYRWVCCMIIMCAEKQDRVEVIVHIIKILQTLFKLNNFNDAINVISGLDTAAVYRLQATWEAVPKKYRLLLIPNYFSVTISIAEA